MSVPFNTQDYERLLRLAEAIKNSPEKAEISLYISYSGKSRGSEYISLEIRGYLSSEAVNEAFKLPTVAEIETAPAHEELYDPADNGNQGS